MNNGKFKFPCKIDWLLPWQPCGLDMRRSPATTQRWRSPYWSLQRCTIGIWQKPRSNGDALRIKLFCQDYNGSWTIRSLKPITSLLWPLDDFNVMTFPFVEATATCCDDGNPTLVLRSGASYTTDWYAEFLLASPHCNGKERAIELNASTPTIFISWTWNGKRKRMVRLDWQ